MVLTGFLEESVEIARVWQETWNAQLESHFRELPVFAVLAGVGGRYWQPVHSFCENQAVACLFPNINVPTIQESDFYSLYFSKGLTLEAQVLAEFLQAVQAQPDIPILQVFRKGAQGEVPAAIFRQIMQAKGSGKLSDRQITFDEQIDEFFWQKLLETERPAALVLWLNEQDLRGLEKLESFPNAVYLSGHLLKNWLPMPLKTVTHQVNLISPWGPQQFVSEGFARMQALIIHPGLTVADVLIQGNVLWLLWLVDDMVEQITDHYSPDFFIERIEAMMGNFSNSSLYPRLSLGTGQRFAAKGSYLLNLEADGELKPVGKLIAPP